MPFQEFAMNKLAVAILCTLVCGVASAQSLLDFEEPADDHVPPAEGAPTVPRQSVATDATTVTQIVYVVETPFETRDVPSLKNNAVSSGLRGNHINADCSLDFSILAWSDGGNPNASYNFKLKSISGLLPENVVAFLAMDVFTINNYYEYTDRVEYSDSGCVGGDAMIVVKFGKPNWHIFAGVGLDYEDIESENSFNSNYDYNRYGYYFEDSGVGAVARLGVELGYHSVYARGSVDFGGKIEKSIAMLTTGMNLGGSFHVEASIGTCCYGNYLGYDDFDESFFGGGIGWDF